MFQLILICAYLTKPLLTYDNCSDETPWFCGDTETLIYDEIGKITKSLLSVKHKFIEHNESEIKGPIPEEFDARIAWPQCRSISRILNQGTCGVCWAVCSTSVMSDRTCIVTGGRDQVQISVDDIVTCCEDCPAYRSHVCTGGGYMKRAFAYFVKTGVVSSKCKTFDLKKLKTSNVPCERTCTNNRIDYNKDKRRGSFVLTQTASITITDVLIEIMKNGPLCSVIKNFGDEFRLGYNGGVYIGARNYSRHTSHTVRIIGWGTKNRIPYWLVANSWGTNWGENGFFRIRRGTNELGIEEKYMTVDITPSTKQMSDFSEKDVGHRISSSPYIQWCLIFKIYILHQCTT